jgi:CRP/FNR family cyclic AMP-dependent transcriptional regulator
MASESNLRSFTNGYEQVLKILYYYPSIKVQVLRPRLSSGDGWDIPLNVHKTLTLSQKEIELLSTYGSISTVPKNCIVVAEGSTTDDFYVILSGRVRVFVSDEQGRQATLNIQGAGEFFGEIALIDGCGRSASVITLEPTRLCVVSKSGFKRCLQENPQLLFRLLAAALQRIRVLTENIKNLALLDVCGRVTTVLESLATDKDGDLEPIRITGRLGE